MARFVVPRLLSIVPTLFVVASLAFALVYLVPGDPAVMMLGPHASDAALDRLRSDLGLDAPFLDRYLRWMGELLQGDLGESIFLQESVVKAIANRLPVTLSVTFLALAIALTVGVIMGVVAAVRHGTGVDALIMAWALLGLSIPDFVLGIGLMFCFSVWLGWLPIGGYVAITVDPARWLTHILLPASALGIAQSALVARMTRSSMLEVLRRDYMQTARSKGLREFVVLFKHGLRNVLIPLVTVAGLIAGILLTSAFIIEHIFNLPGMGQLAINAVKRRDYPIIQGVILFGALVFLVINLVVDLTYGLVNPRIRYG